MILASDLEFGEYYISTEGSKKGLVLKFLHLESHIVGVFNKAIFIDVNNYSLEAFPFIEYICMRKLTPLEKELY